MYRIALPPYLNSVPFHHLIDRNKVQVDFRTPQQLSERIHDYDLMLMPVVELFAHPELRVWQRYGIGCRGAVESVCVFYEGKLENVKKLKLCAESRTSNQLLKLLLNHKQIKAETLLDAENFDAELIIGDLALLNTSFFSQKMDLGKEWLAWTGLPFLFAAWTTPQKSLPKDLTDILETAFKQFFKNFKVNLKQLVETDGWNAHLIERYFSQCIRYDFDQDMEKGLRLFYQYLSQENDLPKWELIQVEIN